MDDTQLVEMREPLEGWGRGGVEAKGWGIDLGRHPNLADLNENVPDALLADAASALVLDELGQIAALGIFLQMIRVRAREWVRGERQGIVGNMPQVSAVSPPPP